MERIIKFKAKRLDDGEWVEGDLYHNVRGFECCIGQQEKDDVYVYPVDPSTVCQFTGIYDLDDNEIYENDLVQDTQTKVVFAVVWNPIYACYSFLNEKANRYAAMNFAVYSSKDILIVGNRFDRKEGEK